MTTMSWKVLAPVAACVLLSLSAFGCAGSVVVRTAPPAERVEVIGVAPSANHFWVHGYWRWNGGGYDWAPGRWEVRREGYNWIPGHWRATGGGWVWEEGRWAGR
jgi:hypothetical protein